MSTRNDRVRMTALIAWLTLAFVTGCDDDDDGDYYPGGIVGAWCSDNAECGSACQY